MSLHVIYALAGYYLFSAAVGAMNEPEPDQKDKFYGWLYRFLQTLAANATQLARARLGVSPSLDSRTLTLASESSTSTLTVTK